MTALDLLQQLHKRGVILTPSPDGTVCCRAPKGVLTPELLHEMRQHKAALLALLAQSTPAHESPTPALRTQTTCPAPLIEERWDLPPCRQCGGRARWLNDNRIPTAPWFMHCAHCSPPPEHKESP